MISLIVALALGTLAVVTAIATRTIERNHSPAGRFIEVDGGRLHVVELGAAGAPPLVLLHGASGNLGDLRFALGDRLSAHYRVILVDRPGHGWSDRPDGRKDASPPAKPPLSIKRYRAWASGVRLCWGIRGRAHWQPLIP